MGQSPRTETSPPSRSDTASRLKTLLEKLQLDRERTHLFNGASQTTVTDGTIAYTSYSTKGFIRNRNPELLWEFIKVVTRGTENSTNLFTQSLATLRMRGERYEETRWVEAEHDTPSEREAVEIKDTRSVSLWKTHKSASAIDSARRLTSGTVTLESEERRHTF